jgi:hypothetical protein
MMNRSCGLLTTFLPLALAALASAAPAPGPNKEPRPRVALPRSVWADLASSDEARVTRAILALGRSSRDTLVFLKQHLRPVKADAKRVAQLLRELESEDLATHRQAQEELEYLGPYVEADLKKARALARGPDLKARIEVVLSRIPRPAAPAKPAPKMGPGVAVSIQNVNGQVQILINGQPIDLNPQATALPQGPSPYWRRAVRAVAVLEAIGTPEARALIEQVAGGEARALPTEEAKAALRRLKER